MPRCGQSPVVAAGKLGQLVRELGPVNAILYVIDRLLQRISNGRLRLIRYVMVAQPLADGTTLRPDPRTLIQLVAEGDDLCVKFPRPKAIIASRFANGAQCLAATVRGEFAGFIWWQTDAYEEDEVRCTYRLAAPAQSVWDFDVYVEPRYRLGRALARLWEEAGQRLAAEGRCWTFSRISAFNSASIASHARLGARPLGSALFMLMGKWQLMLSSMPPFIHFSHSASRRPELLLHPPAKQITSATAQPDQK